MLKHFLLEKRLIQNGCKGLTWHNFFLKQGRNAAKY
jgi:hypothetical protein